MRGGERRVAHSTAPRHPNDRVPGRNGWARCLLGDDLPEAIGISDRLLVMRTGQIVAELDSSTTSETDVMFHATGTVATPEGEAE